MQRRGTRIALRPLRPTIAFRPRRTFWPRRAGDAPKPLLPYRAAVSDVTLFTALALIAFLSAISFD